MGFRERQAEKSKALVKRKTITLPATGESVTVRTLMSGDMLLVNAQNEAERGTALVAFAVEDPETPGVRAYNWNDLYHRQEISGWDFKDVQAVAEAHNEMMGLEDENPTRPGKSSSTVSVPALVSLPEN